MASELAVTLIRFGFLGLLWIFIFAVISVLRQDIFGTMVTPRGRGRSKPDKAKDKPVSKPSASGVPTSLVITGGVLSGTSLPLGSAPIVMGRSPACTLVLDDSYASGQHAQIYPSDGVWWIEDLNSTNGTFVDGKRLSAPCPLGIGVPVRIGETIMELAR